MSEVSETASDAWSTDVLASDTEEKNLERLRELEDQVGELCFLLVVVSSLFVIYFRSFFFYFIPRLSFFCSFLFLFSFSFLSFFSFLLFFLSFF